MDVLGHFTKEQKEIIRDAIDQHYALEDLMKKANDEPLQVTDEERERIVEFYSAGVGRDEKQYKQDVKDIYGAFTKNFDIAIRISILLQEPRVYRVRVQANTSMYRLTQAINTLAHYRPDLLFTTESARFF